MSEIRGNKKVLAHATNVLYVITSLVDNLDDPEVLVEMLKKQGLNHGKKGIDHSMFVNLGVVIVRVLQNKLGSQMDSFATEAWKKTYGVIVSVVDQGLKDAKSA